MFATLPDRAKGLLLAAFGGMVLTFDVPLIRLGNGDVWSVMSVRAACTFISGLAAWWLYPRVTGRDVALVPGWQGAGVGLCYAMSALFFIAAVHITPTANLVFILALNPMVSALLSWLFLKERPANVTIVAIVIMLAAVTLIVEEGLSAGHVLGDLLAFLATLSIAIGITLTRHSGKEMGFVAVLASGLTLFICLPIVFAGQFTLAEPGWVVLNGLVVIPLAFFCLALSPRYLPGAEVAMFYLLETILAPVWVWLIFTEAPTVQVLIAGVVMITTLFAHSFWQIRAGRRRRAAAVRHPP